MSATLLIQVVNLHKSFSQPHGGGGPGAGPIAVSDRIEPFLPRPQVVRRESDNGGGPSFDLDLDRPKSIGRLRVWCSAESNPTVPSCSASRAS